MSPGAYTVGTNDRGKTGCLQRVDRRREDDPFDPARRFRVPCYERVCLQLSECNVLGVVGLGPTQLFGEFPGPTPQHGVAAETDRHSPDAGELVEGNLRLDLAPVHGLVQADSVWERKSVGASSSFRAWMTLWVIRR